MTDHTAHLRHFSELGIDIYLTAETLLKQPCSRSASVIRTISADDQYNVGDFIVKPFSLEHTSHSKDPETGRSKEIPCECYGFLIFEKSTGEKMIYATDTLMITQQFPPVEYLCIECNHFDIKDYSHSIDHINPFVEKRRINSHMSFETCRDFINAQDLSKCKEIRLLHMSSDLTAEQRQGIINRMKNEIKEKGIEIL